MKSVAFAVVTWALLFCSSNAQALTIVVDFKEAGEPETLDMLSNKLGTFDVTSYGFLETDRSMIYDAILDQVRRDYYDIPTTGLNALSPIPDGMELDIDFVVGDIGTPASNGDSEYYYTQVGTGISGPAVGALGQSFGSAVRLSNGTHTGLIANGSVVASVIANNINGLSGLTPSNILTVGDLFSTTHAITGTLSHEIAHTVSIEHMDVAGSLTPNSLPPLMGTGAIDLTTQQRIFDREFSFSGFNSEKSGAAVTYLSDLVTSVGLRSVGTCIAGDADCDGDVDLDDVIAAVGAFTGPCTSGVDCEWDAGSGPILDKTRSQGDVNREGIEVLSAGEYSGDGDVDLDDIITMVGAFTGPLDSDGPAMAAAAAGDPGLPDLVYDPATGEVFLDGTDIGGSLQAYNIKVASGAIINANYTTILGGAPATDLSTEIGEFQLSSTPTPPGGLSIGMVFPTGMDQTALEAFITGGSAAPSFGGGSFAWELIAMGPGVPEPATVTLLGFGLVGIIFLGYRRRR